MSIPREAFISVLALVAGISGCGGSPTSAPPPPPSGTTIDVTFAGAAPAAIAERIGTANWAETSVPTNQHLSFTLPDGTTDYAIAYVCPDPSNDPHIALENEYVFEATISDPTTYTLTCTPIAVTPPTVATGSVDASAIPNTTLVSIYPGFGASVFGSTGSFSDNLLPGIYDFAALAFDFPTNNVLAVKIVRSQTVPGAVNGGNPIKFLASDATTVQSISVTNDPWGGPTLEIDASFTTATGTSFPLQVAPSSASSNLYWVVPSSETQTGDYYSFGASDTNATTGQAIGTTQTATGASAITLAMPAPMASSAPVPSRFPNFTINYAGFSGQAHTASISWNASSIYYIIETVKITITATASFQNGATTLAIPDLTSLLGFFGPATSGTMVTWSTSLSSGTNSSGSSSWVQTSGTYIEP